MENQWYDVNRTLSYNKLLNFVVGPRGVGKTYSCKRYVIKRFLQTGEQFVYLRRYDTELKAGQIELFFSDISAEFEDVDFAVKNGKFYIDGHVAGYYIPLSKAAQYKSVPFPSVQKIIFDEFIIDQGLIRYLPNEVNTFNEMYSTIARLRDVKVLFLSNAITFTNPYFLYFNVEMQKGQTIYKGDDILVELIENKNYSARAASTRFGKIISGSRYGEYAISNEFLRDNDTFVEAIPDASVALFNIAYSGCLFTVYAPVSTKHGFKWYISEKVDKTLKCTISLDIDDHDAETTLKTNSSVWFMQLKSKYANAEVRFTTIKVKNLLSSKLK